MLRSKDSNNNDESQTSNTADDPRIKITRRDALIGTLAAGILKSVGIGSVAADSNGGLSLDLEGEESDFDGPTYNQYVGGSVDTFTLGSTLITIDHGEIDDEYLVADVSLKLNGSDWETFGSEQKEPGNGETEFSGEELFEGHDGWDEDDEIFDFEALDLIEEDYENLGIDEPEESGDPLAVENNFELRFRVNSQLGSVSEEETLIFSLNVGVPLGFGQYFGANFGRDHIEEWPEDWD